jgi:GT2 family glycosyltransferase
MMSKLVELWRRGRLTLKYHGVRELLFRLVTFPLRPTPLGRFLRQDERHRRAEHVQARRWYRSDGRPVTVVIPTYGDPGLVADAVRSVRRTTTAGRVNIVVVDDGSPDLAHREAVRALEGAQAVLLPENCGFAVAANRGIEIAPPDHDVVVLNSDVVAHPGWLERLQYAAYRAEHIGIAGPRLLYPDGRIQSAGSYRNLGAPEWFDHRHRFKEGHHREAQIPAAVIGVTGACMYLKRAMLDEIGAFDDGYGMAYEDMDLCLRAWEAGWWVLYAPRSVLTHHESQTRAVEPGERELASQARFWDRWRGFFDERDVRTPSGRLRIVYVTHDTGVGGGHRDVFEHLNRLAERGHEVSLYSLAEHPAWFDLKVPTHTFDDYDDLRTALEPLDAIKVATWWETGTPVWLASMRHGIPVFFVQDIETSYYPDSAEARAQVTNGYRQEFRYMTISGWNQERLAEMGLDATLVPPGLDPETFRPAPDVKRREDMLLAIGRTNPLKNLPLTVDAWQALTGGRPELCLFGVEPELGLKYGARYVERPTDAGVNELLNEATVFLQTSTHEGFCLPPLESMATGGAVVCTDAHGNRDFCVDGENCLMPDPTVEAVSAAVARLLADPELRERLGQAGLRTAAMYTWDRRIDELEAFYFGLVDAHESSTTM